MSYKYETEKAALFTESGERNTIILQSCTLTEELITQASLT